MTDKPAAPAPFVAAIIVAAGRGSRFGGDLPKQYCRLAGEPILSRTLEAFAAHAGIAAIVTVIHADDAEAYAGLGAALSHDKILPPVNGGAARQASVLAGLEALAGTAVDLVLVHDAARPFVSPALIDAAIAAAREHGAAVPGAAVTDTIVAVEGGAIAAAPERASLKAVQTPQAFRFDLILAAHRQAAAAGRGDFTDDGNVARFAGHAVHVFEGDPANVKITTRDDLARANQRLGAAMVSRSATGFDVHAFGPGDHVWLCGLKIPHAHGFIAHSDGDVALHAITDALLGAMADGDIGRHFPPGEPQWKGASSDRFLVFAAERLRQRGGVIDLLDVTIICEAPRIGPHAEAMRARIAAIVEVKPACISVKATTTERLGFTGRGEGISALATATIRLPL
ncbi:MAG: bifunctional 2-C-methyl-D-erythritol 4-phosphate cytidylyltransferase/2-C-methyl-D-erythritol 2,4-cyclodiphosphate synthase [Methylocystis sp.]|nr:bifunctional 2-C-methyl-D-erythritol 4-phosphate cytidylyltransferase/2-C-methyl-D-erythritol 2,4-cyclodiphosphate synthase [Methylocystis sp.]MCA3583709.1 bifunctional 2-C-methyl-D-erythritol 4-phosphate cytidylyltransferase/2-C-methyl-D-erythritol 2,4-cyclodiphosphate synthase [Methylocystis sp.]MCA3587721.1 bifunctional 2-C-methyl-D-erythritol 4-phosphate cytidylyltransferase/2-C-methyl-D-erythritol 2,4-cyclodiphosphate synthase [Methylocystis sp.]MCA3590017.1 bifunctional 2-C-methyl-D-ery